MQGEEAAACELAPLMIGVARVSPSPLGGERPIGAPEEALDSEAGVVVVRSKVGDEAVDGCAAREVDWRLIVDRVRREERGGGVRVARREGGGEGAKDVSDISGGHMISLLSHERAWRATPAHAISNLLAHVKERFAFGGGWIFSASANQIYDLPAALGGANEDRADQAVAFEEELAVVGIALVAGGRM